MASYFFPTAAEEILQGTLLWLTDDIRAVALRDGASINSASMVYLSDVPAGDRLAVSVSLSGKTVTAGVVNSNAAFFPDFVDLSASAVGGILLIRYDVVEADTLLVGYYDGAEGFPFYGAGRNYYVAPSGSGGWLRL